jgi:DUF1365 family protein
VISALYTGWFRRRRYRPGAEVLRVPASFLYLDLEEASDVFAGNLLWSLERRTPASFRRSDHLGDPTLTLDESVRRCVFDAIERPVDGPIRMLTQLRVWGVAPPFASVYYLFEDEGPLDAVVVSLERVPGLEPASVVLDAQKARRDGRTLAWGADAGDGTEWNLLLPGTEILGHAARGTEDEAFDATLALERRSLAPLEVAKSLFLHPFSAARLCLTL